MDEFKISLCIPQYNRIQFLLKNLSILENQNYRDIEIIISDDASTDNTEQEINKLKSNYKYPIIYYRHPVNVGYDANLRKSLELASGEYCIAMGNDDTLNDVNGINKLAAFLRDNQMPEIGFCNYVEDHSPGIPIVRAAYSGVVGSGQEVALKYYRSFSFVGGIIFRKDVFDSVNTDKLDGSVYVQMYFAARVITNGGKLFMYSPALILKDIRLDGSMANSYRDTLMKKWKELRPIDGGLKQVIWAVLEGFSDAGANIQEVSYKVFKNIYRYTYPFWLLDYRSNGSFVGAVGLTKGLKPGTIPQFTWLSVFDQFKIRLYYVIFSLVGLSVPVFIFKRLKNRIYKRIKE